MLTLVGDLVEWWARTVRDFWLGVAIVVSLGVLWWLVFRFLKENNSHG